MAKKVQPNVKVGGLGTNCKKSRACMPFTKTGSTIITEIFSRYYKLQKGFRNCDFNLSNIFKIIKKSFSIYSLLGLWPSNIYDSISPKPLQVLYTTCL